MESNWVVRIWKSVPDPLDGYFVELGFYRGKGFFMQEDCNWFSTLEIAETFAKDRGIIEYL